MAKLRTITELLEEDNATPQPAEPAKPAKARKAKPVPKGEPVLILLPSAPDFTSFASVRFKTREEWLTEAGRLLAGEIASRCHIDVQPWRVSVGWPVGNRKHIGQCWHAAASSTGHREIFISPILDAPWDAFGVVPTLAHELVHASLPPEAKHGPTFAKAVAALDLVGKPTATFAEEAFFAWAKPLLAELGDYPHSRLDRNAQLKKQTTRLLKYECPECGYVIRVTGKWIEDAGAPICPTDEVPFEPG